MRSVTVLFVDDEARSLAALERHLVKEPYAKRFAHSARKALEIMAEEPVHVIVCDMRMPEMDGLTLLRKVKGLYPETVRVVLSAVTQVAQILPCINSGEVFRYVAKPLEPAEFRRTLRDAIARHLSLREQRELVERLRNSNEELKSALEKCEGEEERDRGNP